MTSTDQHVASPAPGTRRHGTWRGAFSLVAAALIVVVGLGVLITAQSKVKSLPGPDSSNFKDLDQITKANVSQLQMTWFYPYGAPTFSPVEVDGVLYGLARNASSLVALDAATGKELWVHEGLNGIMNKGMNYWQSEDGKDKRLIFAVNSFLQEIDANTGKTIPTFGIDGVVDMRRGLLRAEGTSLSAATGSPGRIWKNTLVVGGASGEAYITPPGDIRAYDVITGKVLWQFHTVPRPGEFGADTIPPQGWKYIGGANNWGELSLDEERGIVYIPTGSDTYDFYGADRHGQDLFANSLIALDCRTGKRLWHFQMVHHDLWDLDNVSAPQLVTVMHDGHKVDAVAHAGKTGFLFVFNRVTGEPLWPIEERPVPKTDVPGEESWPTQPFPTKPPAFVRQSYTVDDVNPYLLTPEQYQAMRERVAKAKNGTGPQGGMYNPPGIGIDAISMPGNQGGSNWGTTAADPQKGLVFVVGVNQVALLQLFDVKKRTDAGRGVSSGEQLNQGVAAYKQNCQSCHGADLRGAVPGASNLVNVTDRMDDDNIRSVVNTSQSHQPRLASIPQADLTAVIAYLSYVNPTRRGGGGGARGRSNEPLAPGPVVARGGAPQPPLPLKYSGPFYPGIGGNAGNVPWPDEVADQMPPTRYMSDYGVMATSTKPPYTTLTAYDLNTGTIKWQVAPGDDLRTLAAGGPTGTGGVAARNGIIVTKTGLLFQTGSDGKVRAFDEDTGKVLWTGTIAGQSLGIPTMYQVKGRQFLVTMSPLPGTGGGAAGAAGPDVQASPNAPHGYIAFALPAK
jgi:quinoprotein glucose dehydrogenase